MINDRWLTIEETKALFNYFRLHKITVGVHVLMAKGTTEEGGHGHPRDRS